MEVPEALYRQSLDIKLRNDPEASPGVAATRNNLASLLSERGEPAEAHYLYTLVLEFCDEVMGPDNRRSAIFVRLGRYTEAVPIARKLYDLGWRWPQELVRLANGDAVSVFPTW